MTTQEKIKYFKKAKNYFKPRKWYEFWKIDSFKYSGFCSFFYKECKLSGIEIIIYFYPHLTKYRTVTSDGLFLFNNHQERYEACIKILENLKQELNN